MKKSFLKKILFLALMLFIICSCSIKKDDLEGATIYTTVYPIKYITNYLYGPYSTINSIYPKDCDLNSFKLTKKQIEYYADSNLFI